MFRHPSYYKKLRASQVKKSDQVISERQATAASERAPGPGLKPQASSSKRQASSAKLLERNKQQASSVKHKGSSAKPQASSCHDH